MRTPAAGERTKALTQKATLRAARAKTAASPREVASRFHGTALTPKK